MKFEEVKTVELPALGERVLVERKEDNRLMFAKLVRRWGDKDSCHWIDDDARPLRHGVECWYKLVAGSETSP